MKNPRLVNLGQQNRLNLPPTKTALVTTINDALTTAVDITLNAGTSFVRIFAIDQAIYVRFAATASSANSDAYIPAGGVLDLAGPSTVTVISLIAATGTAKFRMYQY